MHHGRRQLEAGHRRQPTGGGNSIAVCGLTGAVAVAACTDDRRLPAATAQVVPIWMAALVATVSGALFIPAIVAGVVAANLFARKQRSGNTRVVHTLIAVTIAATGVVLSCLTNIHGAALLAGTLLGLITMPRKPGRALMQEPHEYR